MSEAVFAKVCADRVSGESIGSREATLAGVVSKVDLTAETVEEGLNGDVFNELDKDDKVVRTLDLVVAYSEDGSIFDLNKLWREPYLCETITVFGTVLAPLTYEGKRLFKRTKGRLNEGKQDMVLDIIGLAVGPNPMQVTVVNCNSSTIAVPGYIPDISRDEAYKQAQLIFESHPPPLGFGSTTVVEYGDVVAQDKYYNSKHIFPIGFKSQRLYTSLDDPNRKTSYTSEIVDGKSGPMFRVTCQETGIVFEESTSSAAWLALLKEVNVRRKQNGLPAKGTAISGPEMFGFANDKVAAVLEGLPGVIECDTYVFRAQRPSSSAGGGGGGGRAARASMGSAPKTPTLTKRQLAKLEKEEAKANKPMNRRDVTTLKSAASNLKNLIQNEHQILMSTLSSLQSVRPDMDYLFATGLGLTLNRLRKSKDKHIAKTAKELRNRWTRQCEEDKSPISSKHKTIADDAVITFAQCIGFEGDVPASIPARALKQNSLSTPRGKFLEVLHSLNKISYVTSEEVTKHELGLTVGKLGKHADPEISQLAGSLKEKWLAIFDGVSFGTEDVEMIDDEPRKRSREFGEEEDSKVEKKPKRDHTLGDGIEQIGVEVIAASLAKRPTSRVHLQHIKGISYRDSTLWLETEAARYRLLGVHVPTINSPRYVEHFNGLKKVFECVSRFINYLGHASSKDDLDTVLTTFATAGEEILVQDFFDSFDIILHEIVRSHKHDKKVQKALESKVVKDLVSRAVEGLDEGQKQNFRQMHTKAKEAQRESAKTSKQREMEANRLENQKRRSVEEGLNLPDDLIVMEEDRKRQGTQGLENVFLEIYLEQQKSIRPAPFVPQVDAALLDPDVMLRDFAGSTSCLPLEDFKANDTKKSAQESLQGWIFSTSMSLWIAVLNLVGTLDTNKFTIDKSPYKSLGSFRSALNTCSLDNLHMVLLSLIMEEVKIGDSTTEEHLIMGVEDMAGVSTRRGGGYNEHISGADGVSSFPYNKDHLWPPPATFMGQPLAWPEVARRLLESLMQKKADALELSYANVRPDLLSSCDEILQDLMNEEYAGAFSVPVDPEKDNAPGYLEVVTRPMDLSTIQSRLHTGHYDEKNAPEGNRYNQHIEAMRKEATEESQEDEEEIESQVNKDDEDETNKEGDNEAKEDENETNKEGEEDIATSDAEYWLAMDQRFYEHDSIGGGHEGLAADVRQVWRNCRAFNRSKTRLYLDSKKLERNFVKLYDEKVINRDPKYHLVVHQPEEITEVKQVPELEDLLIKMKDTDYALLPLAYKIRILMVLVDEAIQTTPLRNDFTDRLERSVTLTRDRQKELKDEQREERELATKPNKLRSFRLKMQTTREVHEEALLQLTAPVRLEPLGQDRFFNTYWTFDQCPSIYVEFAKTREWGFYSRANEVEDFLVSLDRRGCRENALHRRLSLLLPSIVASIEKHNIASEAKVDNYKQLSAGVVKDPPVEVTRMKKEIALAKVTLDSLTKTALHWNAAKSEDGEVYYYHKVSRESSWEIPDDIKNQEEADKAVKQLQVKLAELRSNPGAFLKLARRELKEEPVIHFVLDHFSPPEQKPDLAEAARSWMNAVEMYGFKRGVVKFVAHLLTLETMAIGTLELSPHAVSWKGESQSKWILTVKSLVDQSEIETVVSMAKQVIETLMRLFVGSPYTLSNPEAQIATVQVTRHEFRWTRSLANALTLGDVGVLAVQLQNLLGLRTNAEFAENVSDTERDLALEEVF